LIGSIEFDGRPFGEMILDVRRGLDENGAVVVRGLPDSDGKDAITGLASSLGSLSLSDVTAPDQYKEHVHAVEAKSEPLKDSYGFPILSTSSAEFPCHTDDYFDERPSDIVLLQCVRQAETGGDSLIARLADILAQLGPTDVAYLCQRAFPTHFGLVAILERTEGDWQIRYNRLETERSAVRLDYPLTASVVDVLDRVDAAIGKVVRRVRLLSGDCLLLDNRRVVHGRTAFSADSGRLFRRIKVFL
jgi:alpha-ketoglutarate-dependent taurine dioxygenase